MRKSLVVFLLLVFLFNLAGVFIAFKIQRSLIRNGVMKLLQGPGFEKELTVIKVTPGNIHFFAWENENEFRFKGVMYDVVKKELTSKDELILHCIVDKKETRLWNDLTERVKKNNSSHQALNNLVKLFSSPFLPAKKIIVEFFSDAFLIHHFISPGTPSTESDVSFPPPKFL